MELLAELLAGLLELVGELILQLLCEGLWELGLHSAHKRRGPRRPWSPWLAGPAYAALGALTGLLSLWMFPHMLIDTPWVRVLNLVLTPLLAGALMAALGAWRRRRQDPVIRLDKFAYGFLFALAMAGTRLALGS